MSKRCEDCALKRPNFGLPAEGKRRWCAGCARGHTGAINVRTKRTPALKRPRASAAAAPSPSRRPVKRERGAACQLDHARAATLRIDLAGALRDDGTAITPERALAPARPVSAPTPAPSQHDVARSVEADGLQLLITNGARDLATMLTRPGVPHAGAA